MGRRDVRLVLPGRALPPAGAGLQRPRGRPGLRPDQPGDDGLLAEALRPAGDAVRHPRAAHRRARRWPRVSLALFAMAPVDGSFVTDVLPSMVLLGIGAGIAFNPVLLAAMGDVEPHEAGLASGVVNTSFMMGGALGLAVLVAVSDSRTASLPAGGASAVEALHGGLQVAFAVGAVFAAPGRRGRRGRSSGRSRWRCPTPARRRRRDHDATARSPAPPERTCNSEFVRRPRVTWPRGRLEPCSNGCWSDPPRPSGRPRCRATSWSPPPTS